MTCADDKKTFAKKKITGPFTFPDKLDMSVYAEELDCASAQYVLEAVLIHRGENASSGHYIAQVAGYYNCADYTVDKFAPVDNSIAINKCDVPWFELDDDQVSQVKPLVPGGRVLLGESISELTIKSKLKKKLPADGNHRSNNVYMLVYRRANTLGKLMALCGKPGPDAGGLPPALIDFGQAVDADNIVCVKECDIQATKLDEEDAKVRSIAEAKWKLYQVKTLCLHCTLP